MSLKYIHIFFIITASLLCFGFGAWAFRQFFLTHDRLVGVMGMISLLIGQLLIPYLVWFLKKSKKAGLS